MDNNLKVSTVGKPRVNLMLYFNSRENAIEFNYPWIMPISAKLVFSDDSNYTFYFNKNYLRFSNIVAEGWELIDIFRSLLLVALIKAGMYMVHGAAISLGQEGILIPSFGNTGKTTTSWMLAKRGAGFLTDEFAILDSEGNCFGFPCSSLVSSGLIRMVGLRLTKRQGLSLRLNNLKSKILSSRFAFGGVKLYPDHFFQTRDSAVITRVVFIQNGLDGFHKIGPDEALSKLNAVQDYELNWQSNPYVIAHSFFNPSFKKQEIFSKEQKILQTLVSRIKDAYVVSSSDSMHFEIIEKIMETKN